jgi:hypothetical protein
VGHTTTATSVGLARSTAGEQALAWHHRERLVVAAAVLVASVDRDPSRIATVVPPGAVDAARVLDVARRLAQLPGAPSVVPTEPVPDAVAGFATALTSAADAVRHCRQTVHTSRGCWFSTGSGNDGCGEVLHLLHHLA